MPPKGTSLKLSFICFRIPWSARSRAGEHKGTPLGAMLPHTAYAIQDTEASLVTEED